MSAPSEIADNKFSSPMKMVVRELETKKINITMSPIKHEAKPRKKLKEAYYRRWNQPYRQRLKPEVDSANSSPKFNDSNYFAQTRPQQFGTATGIMREGEASDDKKSIPQIYIPEVLLDMSWIPCESPSPSACTIDFSRLSRNHEHSTLRPPICQQPKVGPRNTTKTNSENQSQRDRKINPYTKQEYLYAREKEKKETSRSMSEYRKRQTFINILKPCQIFSKRIQVRDDADKFNQKYVQSLKSRANARSLSARKRAQTAKCANIYNTLEPWEVNNHSKCLDDLDFQDEG